MGSHDAQPDVDALLREARWLRGVARALVGAEAAADLAQEVHLAAARGAAPGERGPRRAWLRTVARRIATRRAAREAKRRLIETEAGAERAAASAEPADLAAERVALQKRLAEALARLAPDDRALLVRRHFDGLSAPELAAELDVSPAAARQRLVRATDRLRAEFARTDEEWRAWSPALAAAAFGRESAATAAGLASPARSSLDGARPRSFAGATVATSSFLTLTIMKKLTLAAVALLALVAAAWLIGTDAGPGRPGDATSTARGGLEPLDSLQAAGGADLGRVEAETERSAVAAAEPTSAAEIVVLDASDRPIEGVRGAWIDSATGKMVELEFDDDGRAPRPEGEVAEVALLGPEHALARVQITGPSEPRDVIHLSRAETIPVTFDVDGAAPGQPIAVEVSQWCTHVVDWQAASIPSEVSRVLGAALLPRIRSTDSSGRMEVLDRGSRVSLKVAQDLDLRRVVIDGDEREVPDRGYWIVIEPGDSEVHVEATRLPALSATVLHGRSGTPYGGRVTVEFVNDRGRRSKQWSYSDPSTGRVRVPLPDDTIQFGVQSLERAVLWAHAVGADLRIGEVEWTPRLGQGADAGTFLVPDLAPVAIEVLRRTDGAPVPAQNARVLLRPAARAIVGPAPVRLDAEGRGEVVWPEGAELSVLADGCALRRVSRPDNARESQQIVLDPEPSLVVPPVSRARSDHWYLSLEPVESNGPRDGWRMDLDERGLFAPLPLVVQVGGVWNPIGATTVAEWAIQLPPSEPLIVSGLLGRFPVTARLVDAVGRTIAQEEIPAGLSGDWTFSTVPVRTGLARLRIEVRAEGDRPVDRGFVQVRTEESGPLPFQPFHRGHLELGPLVPGRVELMLYPVSGGEPLDRTSIDLRRGTNDVVLTMPESEAAR